ncbi:MAG: hypothetical protein KBD78_16920, partial [Oligoflexales bacterium]|nr:hypothetical protein [Oligoflexales bacterium]
MRFLMGLIVTIFCLYLAAACVAERGKYVNERTPLVDDIGGAARTPEPPMTTEPAKQIFLDKNFGVLDEKKYTDSFHPKDCIDYRPWRRNVVGALTVYGSTPSGGDRLWGET